MSVMNPAVPGEAFDLFMDRDAPRSRDQVGWAEGDAPMPSLYLSHGAPPVFDDAHWMSQLFGWSQSMPKPTAVLIVSAHWEAAPLCISSPEPGTPLVYDFGGFAPRYYTMTYATPEASALAARVTALMPDNEHVVQPTDRGLDHGAWVPLKVMYPYGDVPVIQMSMPTHDPQRLFDLGRRLRPLRDEGVLIIGSGFMTHGLPFATSDMFMHNKVPAWSSEFDAWVAEALERGDLDTLSSFDRAPGMPYAHPTVEHYTPLFITMGAATDPGSAPLTVIDDFQFGFAKRSIQYS